MKKNLSFLICVSLVLIFLSSIPYIYGIMICPRDGVFTGYTKNLDDMAVYGSWIKQLSQGFVIHNLFQSNPNGGAQVNVYFNVLGICSRIFHWVPNVTLHIFRIIQGILLVFVFWLFTGIFSKKDVYRKIALIIFLFGSGFGYFIHTNTTIDVWQPEAITFMSVYLNPLFTIGLIVIISVYYNLFKLWKTQDNKYILWTSLLLLILGNIHTYDIVNIYAVWSVFIIYRLVIEKNFILWIKNVWKEIICLIIGLITPLINLYLYVSDPIYKSRVDTPIGTHPIWDIVLGYGLIFVLALVAFIYLLKIKFKEKENFIPVAIWFVLNLVTIYIPFSQQCKFIMGYEIPLCILAAFIIVYFINKYNIKYKKYAFAICVVIMFLTNLSVMQTDINKLNEYSTQAGYLAYLSKDETDIIKHLEEIKNDESVYAPPQIALFIPQYTGKHVVYGHWSETPNFLEYLNKYNKFSKGKENFLGDYSILEKNSALIFDKKFKKMYNNNGYILYKNR